MNSPPPWMPAPRSQAVEDARRTLAALESQASALRLDVGNLRAELAALEREIRAEPEVMPRRSHERVVAAALTGSESEATASDLQARQLAFLATVAHELRHPLMPLRLAALMLDRARQDDVEYARLQGVIKDQVEQVGRLVGDLLDASRMRTGRFRLERTPTDAAAILRRSVDACRPSMQVRHQALTVRVPPDSVMVLGDAVRLVQAFSNLLENASKYTPEGGRISLVAEVHGEVLVVTIADSGVGITPQALPHLFEMFTRDAHAAILDQGGLGIGLAVVRELVKAHEGSVTARSSGENMGSEFIVVLPLCPSMADPLKTAGPT